MKSYVISLEVYCQTTEVTVFTPSGRIRHQDRVATCIPKLRAQIEAVPRPRDVAMPKNGSYELGRRWNTGAAEAGDAAVFDSMRRAKTCNLGLVT